MPLPFPRHIVHPAASVISDVLTLALLSSQIELIMEAIHKTRTLQYKKTMEGKQTCCCFLLYGLALLTHAQSAGAVLNMRVFPLLQLMQTQHREL